MVLLEPTPPTREHDAVRALTRVFGPEPLAQLVRTHAVSTAADACITVSLAGSLFFSVSVDAARPRLTLYLLLTLAPFAVVLPFIGPVTDRYRNARAAFLAFTGQARAVLALFIAVDLRNLLLYPESFAVLVLGRAYSVAKRSMVPSLVPHESDLVAANARLSRIGSLSAGAGGGVAAGVLALAGPTSVLRLAAVLHLISAALALRIPAHAKTLDEERATEQPIGRTKTPIELHRPLLGMAALRAVTGLITFLIAFALKRDAAPTAFFGVVALAATLGSFAGTFVSPVLRRRIAEERWILGACTALAAAGALAAAIEQGRAAMVLVATTLALASSIGRHAFDSRLQRETTDAMRSRVFARTEAILQLAWVTGAIVPTASSISAPTGYAAVGVILVTVTVAVLLPERTPRTATAKMPP
jgi:hypothetical protein